MNNKNYLVVIGICAFALMFALNVRHAINNYGITENTLSAKVLAQADCGGNGGDGGCGGNGDNGGCGGNGGDAGTSVGVCFMRVGPNGKYDQKRFCDSKTNATTIYPCGGDSMDFFNENSKDRCTN